LAELDAIATLNEDSVILIDDARLFLAAPPAPHDADQWPLLADVVDRLRSLHRGHALWIINDVFVFAPAAVRQGITAYARARGIDLQRVYQAAIAGSTARGAQAGNTAAVTNVGAQRTQSALQRPLTARFNAELLGEGRSERIFAHHLQRLGIDRLLDIGSNSGQFATKLRTAGYRGIIYSVEPQQSAYGQLLRNAANDLRWFPLARQAAGAVASFIDLNLAENGWSSSILEVHPNHVRAERSTRIVGKERIYVAPAGELLRPDLIPGIEALKIDVQGYEDQVLDGYLPYLDNVRLLLLELSMVECYQRGPGLFALDKRLVEQHGFSRVSLEPSYYDDSSGVVQQYDGIYHRPDRPRRSRSISGAKVSQVITSIGGPLQRTARDGADLGASWLDLCLGSWRKITRDVLSVAESRPPRDDIRWLATAARPSIGALLQAAKAEPSTHVLLTNADIAFGDGFGELVASLDPEAAYYGHRLDVVLESNALESLKAVAPYEWGFDFFLLPARFLDAVAAESLPAVFRVGEPWWDYLLPLLVLARGFPLKKMPKQAPLAVHVMHPTRYVHELWLEHGARFLESVAQLRALSPCHAIGLLDEISSVPGELEPRLKRIAKIICAELP
jgi:FkbM family methyltransferase